MQRGPEAAKNDQERLAALSYQQSAVSCGDRRCGFNESEKDFKTRSNAENLWPFKHRFARGLPHATSWEGHGGT
jgi:hypothetical protein